MSGKPKLKSGVKEIEEDVNKQSTADLTLSLTIQRWSKSQT